LSGTFEESSVTRAAETMEDVAEVVRNAYIAALEKGDPSEIDKVTSELIGKYGIDKVEDVIAEVDATINIKTDINEADVENTKEKIRNIISEAMKSDIDDSQVDAMLAQLIGQYGAELVESVWNDGNFEEAKEAAQQTEKYVANRNNFPNATGIASAGFLGKIGVPGMTTTANVDEQDLSDGVQKGTELMQTKLIAAIDAATNRLMNRPVNATVNLNPSSQMGRVVLQSNRQFSYVSGVEVE